MTDPTGVPSRLEPGIADAAMRWRHAQQIADDTRGYLITAVREARAQGVSEYRLAAAAGVTRQTVRVWLGKGPAR